MTPHSPKKRRHDSRDRRAIESTECPRCHAWPGYPCFLAGKPTWSHQGGRLFIHSERRAAWVQTKPR